jgi:hypothetical protein
VLCHCLVYVLVNRKQSLAGAPVHLADELTAKCVDDASNRGSFAFADKVEVEHALNSSWLETVNKASCLVVEESMFSTRAQRTAGSCKTADVVVGRKTCSWSCPIGSSTVRGGRRHCKSVQERKAFLRRNKQCQ